MICDSCKKERLVKDFMNNQKFCYQCEYRKRLIKTLKNRKCKDLFCRMCGNQVIHVEDLKKRQRTVFCSLACAQKGHKELSNNHWTRKFRCKGVV